MHKTNINLLKDEKSPTKQTCITQLLALCLSNTRTRTSVRSGAANGVIKTLMSKCLYVSQVCLWKLKIYFIYNSLNVQSIKGLTQNTLWQSYSLKQKNLFVMKIQTLVIGAHSSFERLKFWTFCGNRYTWQHDIFYKFWLEQ